MPTKREKQAAAEFAARAVPGHTYYIVATYTGPSKEMRGRKDRTEVLEEIAFKAATRSSRLLNGAAYPRWYGPHTAYDAYLYHNGEIYEDRNHPKISHLMTNAEHAAYLLRLENETVTGEQWRKELGNAASGTRFLPKH